MSDANIAKWESQIGDLENEKGFVEGQIDDLQLQVDDLLRRKEQIPTEIFELQEKIDVEFFDEPV